MQGNPLDTERIHAEKINVQDWNFAASTVQTIESSCITNDFIKPEEKKEVTEESHMNDI